MREKLRSHGLLLSLPPCIQPAHDELESGVVCVCACVRDVKEVHTTLCRHVPMAFLCVGVHMCVQLQTAFSYATGEETGIQR